MRLPIALPGAGFCLWRLGAFLPPAACTFEVEQPAYRDLEVCHSGPASTAPRGARQSVLQIGKASALVDAVGVHGEDENASAAVPKAGPALGRVQAEPQTVGTCRTTVHAAEIAPGTHCPEACPFWAEETGEHRCRFQCVRSSECGILNANATVADQHGMHCRACIVPGCARCNTAGGGDLCRQCRAGYTLSSDGLCLSPYRWGWRAVYGLLLLLLSFIVWWYVDLRCSAVSNEAGLEHGLRFRSRTRLHKPKEASEAARVLWPLGTNLLRQQVAGPGLALFFNFQLVILVWALVMLLGWVLTGVAVSTDLLVLGTKEAVTPQQLCTVTAWGFKTQHELLWAKVAFMCLAYAASFVGAITFAVLQLRRFNCMEDDATMKDYAATISNLPCAPGNDAKVEEELKEALKAATGEEVVGVSVCWSYEGKAREMMGVIEGDAERRQKTRASFSARNVGRHDAALARAQALEKDVGGEEEERAGLVRRSFQGLNACFGFRREQEDVEEVRGRLDSGTRLVEDLKSTDTAFVVFKTEEGRDRAVEMSRRQRGLKIGEGSAGDAHLQVRSCRLREVDYEPETVQWANFDTSTRQSVFRLVVGVFFILLALVLWTLCFYLPYAIYVTSFSYARGERPTFMATLAFTLLVVAGNQTMYFVCRAVSERARFRCQDTTEMTYLTLYFLACLVNFAMDMAVTSYTTYTMMVGMNARTSGGLSLEKLSTLEVFESYPMQKALGHFFFWYAFPSCFLVPFICEPLFAIWLPGHLMQLLVRAHPNVVGREAEKSLGYFSPMDLSRYSDILLNITMAVMAFLYPGSIVWKMFLVLFLSHLYIIFMDHYRVLRAVPAFSFSTNASDKCVQALTAIPVGLIAACTVFKLHSTRSVGAGSNGGVVIMALAAFTVHLVMHWSLLLWVVPLFARTHERSPVEYAEVGRKFPCSWFSSNPVHCLRSRYLHEHSPPCSFYLLGKEHLLEANPEIGIYFQEEAAEVQEGDLPRQAGSIADWMFGTASPAEEPEGAGSHRPALYSSEESQASDEPPRGEPASKRRVRWSEDGDAAASSAARAA